jgi:hypothetical protein
MRITMTKELALKIQAEQVAWYSRPGAPGEGIGLAEQVAAKTTADALQDGVEYPVHIINEHIPRGGDIEHLCGLGFQKYD